MKSKTRVGVSVVILVLLGMLGSAQPVVACSVCYGDPNSAMSQGAQAGVLVLLGVICTVLTGLVSLLLFWRRRAANLEQLVAAEEMAS